MDIYHCERHPVNLMFVFGFVLAEGRVALQQLVKHAAEAEPVGRRVVACAFGEHFRSHVAVGAPVNNGSLPAIVVS